MASNRFEVLMPGEADGGLLSVVTPTGATWKRGHFVQSDPTANSSKGTNDMGQIVARLAAQGSTATTGKIPVLGFASKAVSSTGLPTSDEILYGGRLEGPVKATQELSIEPLPELMAVEGDDYVDSTAAPSAMNELCAFNAGKIKKGAVGEFAYYTVVGIEPDSEGTADKRFILKKTNGVQVVGASNP